MIRNIVLVALVFPAFVINCGRFQKDIQIPKTTIQEMVDKKFPFDKNVVIARLTLDSPAVYFKDKNIGMKLNYYGNFLNKEIKGGIDFNGKITYRQKQGAFYLTDFNIVTITVSDANFSNEEKLKTTILKITNNYLDDYPVYRLDQTDFKQNIAKLLLRDLKIEGEELVITMGI
jgi:hypothetical protein